MSSFTSGEISGSPFFFFVYATQTFNIRITNTKLISLFFIVRLCFIFIYTIIFYWIYLIKVILFKLQKIYRNNFNTFLIKKINKLSNLSKYKIFIINITYFGVWGLGFGVWGLGFGYEFKNKFK